MSNRVFALPARLSAKTTEPLIGADERFFAGLAAGLDRVVADLERRRDEVRRRPGGAGTAALERDQEVHRLTEQLARHRRFGIDLCLGRMVPADGSPPVYLGRFGLRSPDGGRLLTDWRSPAAEPFFAATLADPRGLTSRRRYRWTNGRITDYWDEAFTDAGFADPAALDDQSAFIASLAESRSGRMRDVLGTIQTDQDAIIRADSAGPLVVDGGPGTGKTVVALHRAAYLLYADPRVGRTRGGVLVVGPNRPYLRFVADVLPSLGEEGVQTCTVSDLVPGGDAALPEADREVAALKADARMPAAVDAAVAVFEERPEEPLTVETDWADLRLEPTDWAETFAVPDPGTPHNEARELIWDAVVELLVDRAPQEAPPAAVRRAIVGDAALRDRFDRAWPALVPAEVVGDLWEVPALLRHCAPWLSPMEVSALRRHGPQEWTVPDLPLLDAAWRRVGDPDAGRRRRRRESVARAEAEQREIVIEQVMEADLDFDGAVQMLRGADLKGSLIDPEAAPEPGPDPLAGPFAHIVVDEAQELTDAEWQMLLARCPSRSFTVVGDRAQARHGFPESWEERLDRVGLGVARRAPLSVNYRTPAEVMEVAEPVIRAAVPDANVPASIRSSGVPVRHGRHDELGPILDEWLTRPEDGVACVIGAQSPRTDPRIRTLPADQVKGLEFDLVVLVEDEATGGPGTIEQAVDRYVALTRTTRELVLLSR